MRGYRKVDANPDLLVKVSANVKEQADVESTPGPGVGYYGYRGGRYGGCQVETNIDVVDASNRKMVWEGRAEGGLNDEAMKNPQAGVDKVVTSWLRR